jgi:hypothetical protein
MACTSTINAQIGTSNRSISTFTLIVQADLSSVIRLGGGDSSLVKIVPGSPTCSAAPTTRPGNPNGIEGFVQITFDLGACGG